MRKIIVLGAALLCFAGLAAAQNNTTATLAADPAPAGKSKMGSSFDYPWQVGMNFTYQRFDIGGTSSNLFGLHTTVNRWLGDSSFGIEGSVVTTFGNLTPTRREHQTFYGGGAHFGARSGKFQPWGHLLAGGAHERFSQGTGPAAFNGIGILGGGGVDIQWRSHIAWRVQADFLGTRYNGLWQKSISTGVGVLFDF